MKSIKNFIRHGKQARNQAGDPTTNVSHITAEKQRYQSPPPPPNMQHAGVTEPNVLDHTRSPPAPPQGPAGGFSVQPGANQQNQAARAHEVAANVVGEQQKIHDSTPKGTSGSKKQDYDPSVIERIVAEERESKGKMPKYPGLERWQLVEKMGDGAFSNVYRAKDTQGQYSEVAIKVVRKFEMNSGQVSGFARLLVVLLHAAFLPLLLSFTHPSFEIPSLSPTRFFLLGQ